MVFNLDIVNIILLLWSVGLTIWIVWRELHFRRFFGKSGGKDVRALIEQLVRHLEGNDVLLNDIQTSLKQVSKADLKHVQKVGLVKFNPFRDSGGNQSFALSLLDGDHSGVVITGLHARETTRLYIKEVHKGTSKSEPSIEEKQAINMALQS